jgi:queuine tRNA-ribosyltransferase
MPVGTAGAVKGITPEYLEAVGAEIILANTYHLMLRPGVEVVQSLGGLHRLMAWDRPILTDSGGYQVFSLGALTKIDDEGVEFASHIDGARVHLNAEIATEVQYRMGSDIIMCFDECTPLPADPARLRRAADRTFEWARRCKAALIGGRRTEDGGRVPDDGRRRTEDGSRTRDDGGRRTALSSVLCLPSSGLRPSSVVRPPLLFGIVQGGTDLDLRRRCAQQIVEVGFDGYALGGLSVGEGHEEMTKTVRYTAPLLPADRPRYLMGVGMPADILAAVLAGVDLFDCVLPTRNGRNAFAFLPGGALRLRNRTHIDSTEPIQPGCDCYCCRHFTRGAIRHFFHCEEMLGPILLSIHNLRFYQKLMAEIRMHIERGDFGIWAIQELEKYVEIDKRQ